MTLIGDTARDLLARYGDLLRPPPLVVGDPPPLDPDLLAWYRGSGVPGGRQLALALDFDQPRGEDAA